MKRLIAITKQTEAFNIDTEKELQFIQNKDNRLTKDKLHNFTQNSNYGMYGGIYYEMENEKIHLYVVENFMYKDIDKKSDTQNDAVVYVASRLHGDGTVEEPKYISIIEHATTAQATAQDMTLEGMGLVLLNARTLDDAKKELSQKFDDFTEDKLE